MLSCSQTAIQTRAPGDRGEGPGSAGPAEGLHLEPAGEAAAAGPGPHGGARARAQEPSPREPGGPTAAPSRAGTASNRCAGGATGQNPERAPSGRHNCFVRGKGHEGAGFQPTPLAGPSGHAGPERTQSSWLSLGSSSLEILRLTNHDFLREKQNLTKSPARSQRPPAGGSAAPAQGTSRLGRRPISTALRGSRLPGSPGRPSSRAAGTAC